MTDETNDQSAPKDDNKAEKKRLKKLEHALETATLDPWQRYRALNDLLEQLTDIVEIADRKTRFALVILGAVNAVNLIVVGRPDLILGADIPSTTGIGIYAATYVVLSLFLFIQAIGALKSRMSIVRDEVEKTGQRQEVVGLRFLHSINSTGFDEYYRKWHDASFGQVNREHALTIRALSHILDV